MPRGPRTDPLKYRRTKIVATLGPSSSDETTLSRLIEAGVDVFRLNFSHGTHESHGATYARVRSVAQSKRQPTAILADLSGPKIRVGEFPGGRILLARGRRAQESQGNESPRRRPVDTVAHRDGPEGCPVRSRSRGRFPGALVRPTRRRRRGAEEPGRPGSEERRPAFDHRQDREAGGARG